MEKARQPEIVRSHQKDQFFVDRFENQVSDTVLRFLGPRWWIKLKREITLCSDMCYFFLTIGSGFQTFGEEYCNMIQVDESSLKIPSRAKRQLMIVIDCVGPYLFEKFLCSLQFSIQRSQNIRPEQQRYYKLFELLKKLIASLCRLHLAYFYLEGSFYALSQRILGLRYILIRRYLKESSTSPSYKAVSLMLAFQLALTSPWLLYQVTKGICELKNGFTDGSYNWYQYFYVERQPLCIQTKNPSKEGRLKCPLCLDHIVHMTSTSCGHVFCWNCIVNWSNTKSECPVCRDYLSPSRVTLLRHFQKPEW